LKEQKYLEKNIIMGIRPEDIHDEFVVVDTYSDAKRTFKIDVAELLGAETLIYTTVNTQPIVARVNARADVHMGDEIELAFDMNKCHFFDPETQLRIRK
jgi:multiple sugar transport system ATP-binding protein